MGSFEFRVVGLVWVGWLMCFWGLFGGWVCVVPSRCMGVFSCGCAGSCVYVCEFLWAGGLVWVHGRVVVRARLVCRLVFVSVSGLAWAR